MSDDYLNPRNEKLTFHVVEMDISDLWSDDRPCIEENIHCYENEEAARAETRTIAELAGGLKALFVVDPRIVSGEVSYKKEEWSGVVPHDGEVPLFLVGHLPQNPDNHDHLLAQALYLESCEGYGYRPLTEPADVVKKLPVVRTVEALDPDEATFLALEADEKEHGEFRFW